MALIKVEKTLNVETEADHTRLTSRYNLTYIGLQRNQAVAEAITTCMFQTVKLGQAKIHSTECWGSKQVKIPNANTTPHIPLTLNLLDTMGYID